MDWARHNCYIEVDLTKWQGGPYYELLGSRDYSYGLLNENLAGVDEGAREHSRRARTALETAAALFQFREHLPEQHAKIVYPWSRSAPDYRLVADII